MNEQNIKIKVKDRILVEMSKHVGKEQLIYLEEVIDSEFVKLNISQITTLPAEIKRSVDEQNKYIMQLFIIKKNNIKDTTKRSYISAIRNLLLQVDKPLTEITDLDIGFYLRWYERRNESTTGYRNQPSTVNNERRFLAAFFSWMRKNKLILENPVESIEPLKEVRKPIDYFKPEELEILREGCKTDRDRALLEVLRSTGCRVGEVVPINQVDIDWATGDILILGEKSGRYRTVYLDEAARYYLKKYLSGRHDNNPALFAWEKQPYGRLSTCGIRTELKVIANRTDMKCRVYPHKMRKTLGMELKNRGADIGIIQEVLGHADPAVTGQYYAQSTADTLRSVRKRIA